MHRTRSNVAQRPAIDTSVATLYAQQRNQHRRQVSSSSGKGKAVEREEDSLDDSHVLALHAFTPIAPNATCLSFEAGQVIHVLNRDPSGWWDGELDGRRGWFPSNYVTGLDQIGKLKDEVLVELQHHSSVASSSSLASHSESTSTFQAADHLKGRTSSPSTSPTLVRKASLPADQMRLQDSFIQPESPTRALSPTFSLYNAIASGAVSTRSISPSLSMASSHQPLLTPLLHAVSLLNRAITGRRQAHYQPSTACVISCVRSLLMSTECLHRDAPVLKRIPALAAERKVILGNQATLVAQARRCSEWPGVEESESGGWQDSVIEAEVEQQDWELEQMVRMGGEVLRNVTKFLEICEDSGVELPVPRRNLSLSGSGSSGSEAEIKQRIREDLGVATPVATPHRRAASGSTTTPASRGPQLSNLRTKSLNDLRARRRMQHLERSKQTPAHPVGSSAASISSVSSLSTSSATSAAAASFPSGPCSPAQVLSALRTSNDALLSAIAAFIGHVHSFGRTVHASNKGQLIELARETVDMVRQLLTIVEAVARHPNVGPRSVGLQLAKNALFESTNALVESVRVMTGTSSSLGGGEEEERWRTLQGATGLLKVAGDCVAAVKVCLSRPIGSAPFLVCLPALSSRAGSDARISYLRRRSVSISGFSTVDPVEEQEEDLTIQAVDVIEDVGAEQEAEAEAEAEMEAASVETVAEDNEQDEQDAMIPEEEEHEEHEHEPEPLSAGVSSSIMETSSVIGSSEGYARSDRSRRSSIGETTPATSVIPEEKEVSPFEEKLLHGELPEPPLSAVPPEVSIPPTPLTPAPSAVPATASDLEGVFALTHDYDARNIAFNDEGAIVGATLDVMIERMTPHNALVDPAFQQIFMMTWRLFVSPSELVDALINRYDLPIPTLFSEEDLAAWTKRKAAPVKLRVANLIKTWLEIYWRTETDDAVLTQLSGFVRETVAAQFPAPAQRILEIIRARAISDDSVVSPRPVDRAMSVHVDKLREGPGIPNPIPVSPSDIPRPNITKTLFGLLKGKSYAAVTVTDFDVLELARQFTIMENKLYLEVKPDELLELGQSSKPSVNVKAISTLSTAITGWVTECILNEEDAKRRMNLVKFFIKLADRCSSLNNFSTSRSILAALDSSTISRLEKTWLSIPQKQKVQLGALRKIADHVKNYSEYRSKLRNTSPPAVPFMGLYLTDITFCREGNPSYRASPCDPSRQLINFNKYHKLARIVQDMQRFQVPYNLKEIPEVQSYLAAQLDQAKNAGDLQDLYRRSLLVEPRRPADSPITPSDGKSMLQIWGLGTLTRNQGLNVSKPSIP